MEEKLRQTIRRLEFCRYSIDVPYEAKEMECERLESMIEEMNEKLKGQNNFPYQWATNRDGYRVLIRNKHPRIVVEVSDGTDEKQLSDALRKAAEFVLKGERIEKPKTETRCVVRRNGKLLAVGISELTLADEGLVAVS